MQKLEIIYEDKELVVCHKMPGIPVQSAKLTQQDMVSLLRNYFAGKKEPTDIYVVHRLDQPVEGVMVFARNQQSAALLSRQVQEKSMDKCYLALAEGVFQEPSGVLEDELLRDGRTNTSKVVPKGTKGAKTARLSYEVQCQLTDLKQINALTGKNKISGSDQTIQKPEYIRETEDKSNSGEEIGKGKAISLVKIQLETGRHHQIRVQMSHMGHPLVGDKKYNPHCQEGYMPLGLCSVKIAFLHPRTKEKMEFTVEPQGKLFENILVC